MEGKQEEKPKTVEEEQKDLIKAYSKLIYKTTGSEIGRTAHHAGAPKFGHSSKFTKPLAYSGMYKYEGLNTVVDRERFVDGCKDWMDKIN